MAMTNCKTCEQPVAKGAIVCPNCGKSYPGGYLRYLIWPLLVIGAIGTAILASQA